MEPPTKVKDFMLKNVVSVGPETLLVQAAELLFKSNLSGMPVIDASGRLVGIITEYDLITKASKLHLPTFLKLILAFNLYRRNPSLISDDLKKILSLKVGDIMNDDPLVLYPETSLEEAILTFSEHHRVNPIPIVDSNHKLVGILFRSDIIKLYTSPASGPSWVNAPAALGEKAVSEFLEGFEKHWGARTGPLRRLRWLWLGIAFALLALGVIAWLILRFLTLVALRFGS